MADLQIDDLNVASNETLITPEQLKREIPLTDKALQTVAHGRQVVRDILDGKDHRLFVVIGPCSIHDIKAAHEYADRLKALAAEVADTLFLVMRVYFEKPRTTVGWKGLINDPYLDDSFKIQDGLHIGRQLLRDLAEKGLPTATEALDPISPQYLQDLISWSAIGARTTESQTHREMASGLSSAVGFKNGTDGSLTVAINALQSVSSPHRFLGINQQGGVSIVTTKGNRYGRKPPGLGQPADSEGSRPTSVRRLHHRRLHRLGDHREEHPQHARQAQGRAAETPARLSEVETKTPG